MQLNARHYVVPFLLLLLAAFGVFAQSDSDHAAQLFKRYDSGAAYNRITENILTLSLSVEAKERVRIAVRVCSKEPLPSALATAGADPFHIAEYLTDRYGYMAERVIFLRSEDCSSGKEPLRPVTEIWTIPKEPRYPPMLKLSNPTKPDLSLWVKDKRTEEYAITELQYAS